MLSENIIDHSEGRYAKIVRFASTHPKGNSFTQCMRRLEDVAKAYPEAKCVIYNDHAPMSLYFNISDARNERIMNGGIIYHGSHDGFGSGSAPTFSVAIDETNGWGLHT